MGQNTHNSNEQSKAMKEYRTVAALININDIADRIDINYSKLDSISAGALKDSIAKTLHGFTLINDVPEETQNYIKKLIKQNMTYSIDIDFAKLDTNEDLLLAFQLKKAIKNTLIERKRALYINLTLNTNY